MSTPLAPSEGSGQTARTSQIVLTSCILLSGLALVAGMAARWSAAEAHRQVDDLRQQVTAFHQQIEVLERRIDELESRRSAEVPVGADRGAHAESVEAPSP